MSPFDLTLCPSLLYTSSSCPLCASPPPLQVSMYINMSVNSSSSADLSLLLPHLSSNSSFLFLSDKCSRSRKGIYIFTAFSITNIFLLLPLSTLILYLGFRRWRRQRSVSTAATTNHFDTLTYNMIAMELIEILGSLLYCAGGYTDLPEVMSFGYNLFIIILAIKIQFHTLTCVERYLAVVHPITYLGLKNKNGLMIINISIGCVWLLLSLWACVVAVASGGFITVMYFCSSGFAFVVICFCSLSVLCTLRRPGPGEVGGDRERVNQSKQRTFHTIMTIMGALLLGLGGMLLGSVMRVLSILSNSVRCVGMMSMVWFSLPSSLVLPLLFLHRAGKLPGCKHNTESGWQWTHRKLGKGLL